MNEKEQSSIEWLIEQIPSIDKEDLYYMEIFEQAKQLHKKEIIEAHGFKSEHINQDMARIVTGEQYYNEKYSQ